MMISSSTSADWDDFWNGPNPDNVPSIFSDKMTASTMKENVIDRDELQSNLINQVLDDMDLKTMYACLYDYMSVSYDKYSVDELIEEVEEYYPDLLENE